MPLRASVQKLCHGQIGRAEALCQAAGPDGAPLWIASMLWLCGFRGNSATVPDGKSEGDGSGQLCASTRWPGGCSKAARAARACAPTSRAIFARCCRIQTWANSISPRRGIRSTDPEVLERHASRIDELELRIMTLERVRLSQLEAALPPLSTRQSRLPALRHAAGWRARCDEPRRISSEQRSWAWRRRWCRSELHLGRGPAGFAEHGTAGTVIVRPWSACAPRC